MEAVRMSESSALKVGKIDFLEEEREALRNAFLKREGLEQEPLFPLPSDASKRRYFRLPHGLLMDAPPPYESTTSFQQISELLSKAGLTVPRVYAADHTHGFLIIEDLGEISYRKALEENVSAQTLYGETVRALIQLHQKITQNDKNLLSYDLVLFLKNASLFLDWYAPSLSPEAKASFQEVWAEAYENQPQLPLSLSMRDVMVDNLMWLPEREGFKRCGFIDFQDGAWGPISYDLVSLLEDSRWDISSCFGKEMVQLYFQAFPELSEEDFWESYCLWGAQRSTRIIGVFARLAKRDSKPHYLAHLPRIWKYLKQDLEHPSLTSICKWFEAHVRMG